MVHKVFQIKQNTDIVYSILQLMCVSCIRLLKSKSHLIFIFTGVSYAEKANRKLVHYSLNPIAKSSASQETVNKSDNKCQRCWHFVLYTKALLICYCEL